MVLSRTVFIVVLLCATPPASGADLSAEARSAKAEALAKAARAQQPVRPNAPLPIPSAARAAALNLPASDRSRVMLDAIRLLFNAPDNIQDDGARRRARLADALRAPHDGQRDVVPLPLGPTIWQDVVGESPADARRFVRSLFGSRDGRLAFFYDSVAHLDPPHQRFALGLTNGKTAGPARDLAGIFRRFAQDDAVARARSGQFEALPAALGGADQKLSVAFLAGLAMYARGDFDLAASRFRVALKADSEFFPAAFYLGACYAAVGRHRDAANAWRTSLVTESDAPFIYPLIADALLRGRDAAGAVAILKEATGRWPDNEQLQVRRGSALAIAGKPADAVCTLDAYIARHPDDHQVIFTALRAIYEARNAGVQIESPERDRERFARYAVAYAAAGGPQQALVERWRKFIEGR